MIYKIILIFLLSSCGIVYSIHGDDDDCGEDLDLRLTFVFNVSGRNISGSWEPVTPTDCPLLFHVVAQDDEFGVIQDEYLEDNSVSLKPASPCIFYQVTITAINQAFPTVEGPRMSMGITFSPTAQIAPTMQSVDVTATSFNMTWALEGDANRCPLKTLYVDGGKYFNITVPLQDLTDRSVVPVEISSLKANSMYYFRVYVENSAGLSPASQMAIQTLDITDN